MLWSLHLIEVESIIAKKRRRRRRRNDVATSLPLEVLTRYLNLKAQSMKKH